MVQLGHVGQEGQGEQQEQHVEPRRAASAEPHKRLAVAAVTVAAGGHVAPAAPGDWQMVVRGRGRAARRQAAAASTGGGPMAYIVEAIRCGRAFDCTQCGELGMWQGPRCGSCEGIVAG